MDKIKLNELIIPPDVLKDPNAKDILRIWTANNQQYVSINTKIWEDVAAWGIMLVDIAKHIANYQSEYKGENKQDILSRIKMGFDAEWGHPTSEPTGKII
jgi:hypothetical protein